MDFIFFILSFLTTLSFSSELEITIIIHNFMLLTKRFIMSNINFEFVLKLL